MPKTISLRQHILNILMASPEGLSDRELADAVKKTGYVSRRRSGDFLKIVRNNLNNIVNKGRITKTGSQKSPATSGSPPELSGVQASEVSDLALLREFMIEFAKSKGFANPESFPDMVIHQRRQYLQAETHYLALFKTWGWV